MAGQRVEPPLTKPERRLRVVMIGHAILSAFLALGYVVGGETAVLTALPNSFAKDALLTLISFIAAGNIRRYGWIALAIAFTYVALPVGQIITIIWGGAPDPSFLGIEVPATLALLGWMSIDLAFAVLFTAMWVAAERSRFGLKYLNPIAFRGLMALAEVLVEGRREAIDAEQVARNVDRYLDQIQARGRSRVHLALTALCLFPLLKLHPPLPTLDPETRKRFLQRHFLDEKKRRRTFGPLRRLLQVAIRTGSQMSYLGYYGDRRTWSSIGYTPYSEREGSEPRPERPDGPALVSLPRPPRDGSSRRYDVIVIGSGAAGGVLAYRFAEAGKRVLVVERGPHADPRDFTEDEVGQYLRLYNEGALQLATNFSLQVLQGMCVGGGTTINNGLCLDPPTQILDEWEDAGIDGVGLEEGIRQARGLFAVGKIREDRFTHAATRFGAAVGRLGLPGRYEVMDVNISRACRGCGYTNIGCMFNAKNSTLDTVLPWGQDEFPGMLDVLADFEVERIERVGTHRAGAVVGLHKPTGERVALEADDVVIAAGAVASSYILQASNFGGDAVGHGLHFNVNSPLTVEYREPVDSFAGIQMSHAYVGPGPVPEYLVETWFNPPATQALAMPGWFDRHFDNMSRYRNMACAGVLVGTTTPGRVKPSRSGPRVEYTISPKDLASMAEGLEVAGRIMLEAGAIRLMPATFGFRQYTSPADLNGLRESALEPGQLLMTSAHPQGGNAVGRVVDKDFRVMGVDNLYVCDASVFPSSVRINPQLTVMGMAEYGSRRILARMGAGVASDG